MERESLEISAKTVEEAIEIALKELDAEREEVDVVVVAEGRSGILGIRSEPARVRVTPRAETPEAEILAKEVLETLLGLMDADATVRFKDQEEIAGGPLSIEIIGDDSGLLIGRSGMTLNSLQYIVNFLVSRRLESWQPVNIDVEGYKQRRHKSLTGLAHRLAEKVRNSGRAFTLEPMSPSERRVIHMALSDHRHVTTESTGLGDNRKVSIKPRGR